MAPDPQIVRQAASEHRSRTSLADAIGCTPRQLARWRHEHPEIRNAMHLGDADRLAMDFYLCVAVVAGSYGSF